MKSLITVEEAVRALQSLAQPLGTEFLPLEAAVTRILAEAIQAEQDYPPWTNAAMDGFALRSADLKGDPPYTLKIVQTLTAGDPADVHLGPGEAVRIMTGAPVPAEADTVVQQEWTEWDESTVTIKQWSKPGLNIRPAGEDFKSRTVVLHAGQYLTPAAITVAASAGRRQIEVFRRPRVGVITTGDELLEPGQPLSPGKIWESNSYYLVSRMKTLGLPVHRVTRVIDRLEVLKETLFEVLRDADVILTCGGVSVGDRDYVRPAWEALGGEIIFHGVAVKPGKPFLVGQRDQKILFGLPGNPASVFVTFERFVRPWLWWVQGVGTPLPLRITASLRHPLVNHSERVWYVRARLWFEEAHWQVIPLAPQGSHIVTTTAEATALIEVPPQQEFAVGQSVVVLPLYWEPYDLLGIAPEIPAT